MKDAMFKFYITANINVRAKEDLKEYRSLKKGLNFKEVSKKPQKTG